jgi:hypothetical protein
MNRSVAEQKGLHINMDTEEIRQLWAEGVDWVIKRHNRQYFFRTEGKPGPWRTGLPPGVFLPDVETLFEDS